MKFFRIGLLLTMGTFSSVASAAGSGEASIVPYYEDGIVVKYEVKARSEGDNRKYMTAAIQIYNSDISVPAHETSCYIEDVTVNGATAINNGDPYTNMDLETNDFGVWYQSTWSHGGDNPSTLYSEGNQTASNRAGLAGEAVQAIANDEGASMSGSFWAAEAAQILVAQRYHNNGNWRYADIEATIIVTDPDYCVVQAIAGRSESRNGSSGKAQTEYDMEGSW
ncbi:MAG: hypothetical protein AAF434_01485 [Pseudomonadota bacterium]